MRTEGLEGVFVSTDPANLSLTFQYAYKDKKDVYVFMYHSWKDGRFEIKITDLETMPDAPATVQ